MWEQLLMVVVFCGIASVFVIVFKRQRAQIEEAKAATEAAESALKNKDARIKELDDECNKLSLENRLRKEYAYVCEHCRRHKEFGGGQRSERNDFSGGKREPLKRIGG